MQETKSIQKFMKDTYKVSVYGVQDVRPRIVCKDGFSFSAQAAKYLYCEPKKNLPDGKYNRIEIGFPNMKEELLIEYAQDVSQPTETVYPYVPVEIVDKVIHKHGGMI